MKGKLYNYYLGIALFILFLVIGCLVHKDYGFGWDEAIHRRVGYATYNYVFNHDAGLKTLEFRNLGSGFELLLVLLEKALNISDKGDITFMRHLVTHIFFLIGAFAGYVLALRLFKSPFLACIAFLMLACHPRMYAHSFFNSKDIPFAAMFTLFFLLFHIAFSKNRAIWFFAAGAAAGYATSIRVLGLMLLPCAGMLFLADMALSLHNAPARKTTVRNALFFIAGFCVLLYTAWPLLWSDPLFYLTEEFKSLSHVKWGGDVFFNGSNIKGNRLPFIYVPEWIAISTPGLWVIAGAAGCIWIICLFMRHPLKFYNSAANKNYLLYLACFILPVVIVWGFKSVNYDDWRHLYFIYPAFVFLALYLIYRLYRRWRKVVAAICIIQVAAVIVSLVQLHPFEHVYFNNFVSHRPEHLRASFDMDYWGLSYRKGLEYIAAHDDRAQIKVSHWSGWIEGDLEMLPLKDRKRILFVQENDNPDYFITDFRNHPDEFLYPNTCYDIKVLNSTILKVYKLN